MGSASMRVRHNAVPHTHTLNCVLDHEAALSATRNLNRHEIGGRPLRVNLADSDPFLEGKTTVRGQVLDDRESRTRWRERNERERGSDRDHDRHRRTGISSFLQNLPKGVSLPPGTNASDAITNVLATSDPSQIMEVLAHMKVRFLHSVCEPWQFTHYSQAFVITHPDHAHTLLAAHPQLGYALFQALLMHRIVDPAILNVCRSYSHVRMI